MTEKKLTLPCGHTLEIRENGATIKAILSTDSLWQLGVSVSEDGKSATIYAYLESLPVLRDLLLELAPLPKPHEIFGKNIRGIFKFLKGGKS
jgi:hypothetical protein